MQKLVEHAETYFSIAAGTSGAAGNSGAAGSSTADAAIVARKKSRPELHNELLAAVDSKENETTEWPKDRERIEMRGFSGMRKRTVLSCRKWREQSCCP